MGQTGLLIAFLVLLLVFAGIAVYWYATMGGPAVTSGPASPAPPPPVSGGGSGTDGGKGTKDQNGHNAYGTWANPVDPTNPGKDIAEILTLGLANVTWGEGSYLTQPPQQGNLAAGDVFTSVTPLNPAYPEEVIVVNHAQLAEQGAAITMNDLILDVKLMVENDGSIPEPDGDNAVAAWAATVTPAIAASWHDANDAHTAFLASPEAASLVASVQSADAAAQQAAAAAAAAAATAAGLPTEGQMQTDYAGNTYYWFSLPRTLSGLRLSGAGWYQLVTPGSAGSRPVYKLVSSAPGWQPESTPGAYQGVPGQSQANIAPKQFGGRLV